MNRPLPPELLKTVVDGVEDPADLRTLRVTCSTISALATPLVFCKVFATNIPGSGEKLASLLNTPYLAEHVEKIVYHNVRAGIDGGWDDGYWDGEDPDTEAAHSGLVAAFSLLKTLPKLHTLHLSFFPSFQEESSSWIPDEFTADYKLQLAILQAVADCAPRLRSLTLHHLTPFPNALYEDATFLALFSSLTHLTLSVASDTALEGAIFQETLVEFWEDVISQRILGAAAASDSLTSLAILSDQDISNLSLSHTFPALTHLTLEHIMFEGDNIEAFLLSHADTVRALTLRKCKIAMAEFAEAPERYWREIWETLAEKMENLHELDVVLEREGDDHLEDNPDGQPMCYASMDSGWGWQPYHEDSSTRVPGDEGDEAALKAFIEVVRARKESSLL